MQAADFIAMLVILNRLFGKVSVSINDKELTYDELYDRIKDVQVKILKNKEDDLPDKTN